ncbi:MAG: hypothetical protein CJBNEKGG_00410 [Prosthecobacter sp.]|nr:hypothetical protein [Prosthecobacter sp.]
MAGWGWKLCFGFGFIVMVSFTDINYMRRSEVAQKVGAIRAVISACQKVILGVVAVAVLGCGDLC